jgi:hypothetical protein
MNRTTAYQSIVDGTARAIDGTDVALIRSSNGERSVVAVSANGSRWRRMGESLPVDAADSVGFVFASGQPLSIGSESSADQGASAQAGPLLVVPCLGDQGVLGALEIRGDPGAEPFGQAASRLAALFADIAAAVLEDDAGAAAAPSPAELAAELSRLAEAEPSRYVAVATTIEALLGHG